MGEPSEFILWRVTEPSAVLAIEVKSSVRL